MINKHSYLNKIVIQKSKILCFISSDIDFCVGNKCFNGRCIDGIDSYTCDCTGTGYEGDLCEKGI